MRKFLFIAVLVLMCLSSAVAFTEDKPACQASGAGCTVESCCKKDACSCSCCKESKCKCCNEKCCENCTDKKK